jgi:hypothetical protein
MSVNRRIPRISPFCLVDDQIKDAPYPLPFIYEAQLICAVPGILSFAGLLQ